MVLPTRVNIINNSSDRIKVKIDKDRDRKLDEIINIEPGGRLDGIEGSVEGSGRYDVIVDLITNPGGPDNNTRLGGFKFDNPSLGYPNVRSDEFTTLTYDVLRIGDRKQYLFSLTREIDREFRNRTHWGMLDRGLLDNSKSFDVQEIVLVNSAPKPSFTIESFFNDSEAGAKVWDLRINSDNFTL
ncbi:hypothetical protein [Synechococcus sp. LA31]|uniref:hypothetical protein n=1 Tax=Synechococcus sp. LA31 TaxID=2741953 RepID=UPI001BDD0875|nr:hypothetical protein [Synechococcus sp. LA31]QVV68809.1 hypothetical protein KJJ24_06795 [Synechococcus sp. LA31]